MNPAELQQLKRRVAELEAENRLLRNQQPSLSTDRLLQALSEGTTDAIFVKDASGKYLHINSAGARFSGLPKEQIVGKDDHWIFDHASADALIEQDAKIMSSGKTLTYEEAVEINGNPYVFLSTKGPLRDDAGKVIGLLGISRDISDLKRRENEEKDHRRKSEYMAYLSHEVRTPLAAIIGFSEAIITRQGDAKFSEQANQSIYRNSLQIFELLNDFLDMSRLEANKVNISNQSVCPHQVCSEVAEMMLGQADRKNVEISVECSDNFPSTICCDPLRLHQILVNLVGNAIKFTDQGFVRIELGYGSPDEIEISVVDSGIGISVSKLSTLFKPYTQAGEEKKNRLGTGLGLSIVKKLAELMNGAVSVTSVVGEGSRFSLRLPMRPAVSNIDGPATRTNPDLITEDGLTGCRILIAEDSEDIRTLLGHWLQCAGASTTMAENGLQAVECVAEAETKQLSYDAILMDMQMPIMDGLEACRSIRRSGFDRPIIALSASTFEIDRANSLDAGCSSFLIKPVHGQVLVEKVKQEIAKQQP